MTDTHDLIAHGYCHGGYVAAIRAAQLGLKTATVERGNLGGTPTKPLRTRTYAYDA